MSIEAPHIRQWQQSAAGVALAAAVVVALSPWGSPGLALLLGLALALTLGNPLPALTRKVSKPLLQASVVLLGFGMNLGEILTTGAQGLIMAVITITVTFVLGWLFGRLLKMSQRTTALVSAGTAICGGSAIAAVAIAIAATEAEMSVAMGTVFILNSVALYLFPLLGHALHMSPTQFGEWAGIAIHDVSSVVGAAASYTTGVNGRITLETATAVKLARSLWIIPVALGAAVLWQRQQAAAAAAGTPAKALTSADLTVTHDELEDDSETTVEEALAQEAKKKRKLPIPWFIGLFLLAALMRSLVPAVGPVAPYLVGLAKLGMNLTLLLIGLGLSRAALKTVGVRPLILGLILWAAIGSMSLLAIEGM